MTTYDWVRLAVFIVVGAGGLILGPWIVVRALRRDVRDLDVDELPPLHVVPDDDRPLHEQIGDAHEAHLRGWYEGPYDWETGGAA